MKKAFNYLASAPFPDACEARAAFYDYVESWTLESLLEDVPTQDTDPGALWFAGDCVAVPFAEFHAAPGLVFRIASAADGSDMYLHAQEIDRKTWLHLPIDSELVLDALNELLAPYLDSIEFVEAGCLVDTSDAYGEPVRIERGALHGLLSDAIRHRDECEDDESEDE